MNERLRSRYLTVRFSECFARSPSVTTFVVIGLGVAGGIALGLLNRMFQVMPLPLRVAFRAAG